MFNKYTSAIFCLLISLCFFDVYAQQEPYVIVETILETNRNGINLEIHATGIAPIGHDKSSSTASGTMEVNSNVISPQVNAKLSGSGSFTYQTSFDSGDITFEILHGTIKLTGYLQAMGMKEKMGDEFDPAACAPVNVILKNENGFQSVHHIDYAGFKGKSTYTLKGQLKENEKLDLGNIGSHPNPPTCDWKLYLSGYQTHKIQAPPIIASGIASI